MKSGTRVVAAPREPHQLRGPHVAGAGDTCVHELFAAQAALTPDAVAVIADGAAVSYAALESRVAILAARLQQAGAGPGSLVGVCLDRSADMVVALLAVLLPPSVANAQSVAELEEQIDARWRELEPIIEDYNRLQSELEENQERSDELSEKLAPLELRRDRKRVPREKSGPYAHAAGRSSGAGGGIRAGAMQRL